MTPLPVGAVMEGASPLMLPLELAAALDFAKLLLACSLQSLRRSESMVHPAFFALIGKDLRYLESDSMLSSVCSMDGSSVTADSGLMLHTVAENSADCSSPPSLQVWTPRSCVSTLRQVTDFLFANLQLSTPAVGCFKWKAVNFSKVLKSPSSTVRFSTPRTLLSMRMDCPSL